MKKKLLLIIGGVLLLFIITNPSVSAFKTYRGKDSYEGLRRPVNLFIYSIYRDGPSEFVGAFGNFWRVRGYGSYVAQTAPVDTVPAIQDTVSKVRLTIDEFAARIKKKYPAYRDMDNRTLVDSILSKYPMYKETVILN